MIERWKGASEREEAKYEKTYCGEKSPEQATEAPRGGPEILKHTRWPTQSSFHELNDAGMATNCDVAETGTPIAEFPTGAPGVC